jgi:Transposase domain (DUF772)
LLLQVLYTVRSERMMMEQLEYNVLYRWFIGLNMDDPIWDVTVFTKNRMRFLDGEIADKFFSAVLDLARKAGLLSEEHFTVDGTLIEAWASHKSFRPKDEIPARIGGCSGCRRPRVDGAPGSCASRGAADAARGRNPAQGLRGPATPGGPRRFAPRFMSLHRGALGAARTAEVDRFWRGAARSARQGGLPADRAGCRSRLHRAGRQLHSTADVRLLRFESASGRELRELSATASPSR